MSVAGRFAHVCLIAVVVATAGSATGSEANADAQDRAAWRDALLGVYVHGVTEETAHDLLGVAAVPYLHELLQDPGFPRRDNVVAFLAHLGDHRTPPRLLGFLSRSDARWEVPADHRALVTAPMALGPIARRGDPAALEALLAITASEAHDAIERAASRAPRPAAGRTDLIESAMTGLALSAAPAGRDRLVDLTHERIRPPGVVRDLSESALTELRLFDELHTPGAPPTGMERERDDSGGAGAGGPPDLESMPGGGSPGAPANFDTQSRVHDNGISYANHVNTNSPMGNQRLDTVFDDSNLRAGRADYGGDVGCCITVSRTSNARQFGSTGDGLDVIQNSSELNQVLGNGVARIKVVNSIRWCGGPGFGIVGCAWTPGNGIAVVRLGGINDEGILWLHEYGHNTGLGHSGTSRHIMYGALTGNNDGLTQGQCNSYHSPSGSARADLTDTGACTDNDADEVQDGIDNCPNDANAGQANGDGDPWGEACDNCPADDNPDQLDFDLDDQGDVCDADDDNDGVLDESDCDPFNAAVSEDAGPAEQVGWIGKTELTWVAGNQAELSNVYRGTIAGGFNQDWSCLANDVAGTSYVDGAEPPFGEGLHYLVTGENVCAESDGGDDSSGNPREFTPCP